MLMLLDRDTMALDNFVWLNFVDVAPKTFANVFVLGIVSN